MMTLITGASGSGKSLFAEQYIDKKRKDEQDLVYLATMKPYGEETKKKITRHKEQRCQKGFQTIECYEKIEQLKLPIKDCCVLLECLSNLLANEMYPEIEEGSEEEARVQLKNEKEIVFPAIVQKIYQGILHLEEQCQHLVIVTNEIFSEPLPKWEDSAIYTKNLGLLNQRLANHAKKVYEVIAGVPILHKQMECLEIQEKSRFTTIKGKEIWKKREREESMLEKKILVLGGAFQGKTKWAKEYWQIPKEDCFDVRKSDFNKETKTLYQSKLVAHIEKMVEWYCQHEVEEESQTSQQDLEKCWVKIEKLWENAKNPILIVDEIGYGMVPMERNHRRYRELAGRMTCKLAEQADEVYRVIAGIPQRLK